MENVNLKKIIEESAEKIGIDLIGFAGKDRFEGVDALDRLELLNFEDSYAKDMFSLIRMLLFFVLFWLVVASWICFYCRVANIVPILEQLRYPTNSKQKTGFDVFKIISLGTITLDTEFTLGRFLQYNLILLALFFVLRMTGTVP